MRETLIEAVARDEKIEELNQQLNSCIDAQDGKRYCESVMLAERHIFKAIDRAIVFKSYRFFAENLENFQSSRILRELIEVHISSLIGECSLQSTTYSVFCEFHRLADELIGKLRDGDSAVQQHLDNYLAVLACFYSPKHHKELKFVLTDKGVQLVLRYIIQWSREISKSLTYLRLLINVLNNN